MERAKAIGQIIAVIKQLKKETDELFAPENIINHSELLIEEYFQQLFNPFLKKVKADIRSLPLDEYLPIELDSWIRILKMKLVAIERGEHTEKYAEVLYIKQRFYPELIDVLKELQLEALEAEFDARVDREQLSKPILGPNTIVLSIESVAMLITMLYNFNIISGAVPIDDICRSFAAMTGYNAGELKQLLRFDEENGRLTSIVKAEDMDVLLKLLRSIVARIENLRQYTD
ncbi:MAG TPA: hypothetical protein PLW22_09890 [Tenuifilum sp.]|uniref:hypothetical protein n=1 Tax=Tenuifilum sp. TaxID=2760880 RepID=UPI002B80A9BC|nr:hypothetical protein [Tenuifilum sp.]